MNRSFLALVVVSLLAVPVAAHGDHNGVIEEQKVRAEGQVAPGRILELDFEVHEGAVISYGFTSRVAVSWDIHEHANGTVLTHAQEIGVDEASGTFTAPHDGVFSFMVVSFDNSTGKVRMSLEGPFALVGSAGVEMQDAPGPALGVVALSLGALLWAAARSRRAIQ